MYEDSELRKRLIEAGRKQRLYFSWDIAAQKLWNVIEHI
jgi:glycosyltransferase involved in cell wall biosynthesis